MRILPGPEETEADCSVQVQEPGPDPEPVAEGTEADPERAEACFRLR